jgi:hypothetical protein
MLEPANSKTIETVETVEERMGVRLKPMSPSKTPEARAAAYRKWREQNPEQAKEILRKRAAKRKANNPEKVAEETRKANRKWRANNPDHVATSGESHLKLIDNLSWACGFLENRF